MFYYSWEGDHLYSRNKFKFEDLQYKWEYVNSRLIHVEQRLNISPPLPPIEKNFKKIKKKNQKKNQSAADTLAFTTCKMCTSRKVSTLS